MSAHTKEPWIAEPESDCHAIAWVGKIGIFQACGSPHREWADPEVDARRIVACVNACAPIETSELEEIERTGGLLGPREDIARLAAQRNELLAAARAAEAVFARQKWLPDSTDPEAVALRMLRAAIAKAEGRP